MDTNKRFQRLPIAIDDDIPMPDELRQPPKRGRPPIAKNFAVIDKAARWILEQAHCEGGNANVAAAQFIDELKSTSKASKQAMLALRIRAKLRGIEGES